MHRPFRSLSLAIALASGAGLLVLPDPALSDPPDWAKANGHRSKHAGGGKHQKHHRHGRDEGHGDSDDAIVDWDDSHGSTYPAPSFREADTWHPRVMRQSVFGGGVCIPHPSAAFGRSRLACRELVTQGVHRGKIREVRRTACRDRDGAWRIVD